ncbi:hypothetical protein QYF36_015409 [Acer negundo]|nr:hypothetical protein QYF36_015409 [Acer negundo]
MKLYFLTPIDESLTPLPGYQPYCLREPLRQSQPNQGLAITASVPESKPKKKICCACPETKKLRDECIVEHGEESCAKWIEAHRKCLHAEGFNVFRLIRILHDSNQFGIQTLFLGLQIAND